MHLIKLCIQQLQFLDVLACSPTFLEADLVVV